MKLSNLRNEIYLNSTSIIKGYNNSVYDLLIKDNYIYIPEYRNNKLLIYDLLKNKLIDEIKVNSPHSIYYDINKFIITTYKFNKVYYYKFLKKKEVSINYKLNRPICVAKSKNFYLIINWTNKNSDKLLYFDNKFNFIKTISFNEENFFPHYVIYNNQKFFIVNHSSKNPKIFILDVRGNLIEVIKNNYIRDPISIKFINNNYFICDYLMNSITIFDDKFNFKYIYDIDLNYPMNVAIFKNRLFVSEELSNRIFSLKVEL